MKTLYISDLDGTLLNSDQRVPEYSVRTLNRLIKSGMIFTYATARSFSSASIITGGLNLENPAALHNGAFIIDVKTGRIIHKSVLQSGAVKIIAEFLTANKIYPLVYSLVDGAEKVSWLSGKENDGILNYISSRKGGKRLRQVNSIDSLYKGDIFYFTCIGNLSELLPVYKYFSGLDICNVVMQKELYEPEYWCELMPKDADKASAALKLKEVLGCDRIISFGDGLNDIGMFKVSDECYAMSNAAPELKEIAAGVIGSCEEDGVARWLENHSSLAIK
ncbi:MAG: HAD family hydrolase [Treponema sp.]|nr:HAD family hydrolase [Treponema sp.]